MSQKRLYPKCSERMQELGKHLEAKYGAEDYDTQLLSFEEAGTSGTVFQMKPKEGVWQTVKNWTGMECVATVTMRRVGDALEAEVGGGKWLDKAALATVSMIVLWPLLVTASIGAWGQRSLLNQVVEEVDAFFRDAATSPRCKACGAEVPAGNPFCGQCGKPVA